jgi:hypothetical protein
MWKSLCRCKNRLRCSSSEIVSGAFSMEDPPVPISNTVVKLHCGENSVGTSRCEDSTVPDYSLKTPHRNSVRRFLLPTQYLEGTGYPDIRGTPSKGWNLTSQCRM